MFDSIINKIEKKNFIRKWRLFNKNNTTKPGNVFDMKAVSVGDNSYGTINVLNWGRGQHLSIGNYCSIAQEVMFVLNADHYVNHISTFPFKVKVLGEKWEGTSKGDIIVEDDVWIGYNATIMSGVRIGQGAVIAAGAVVTKDIPPYAIVGGVPAKLIKYRFEPEIVEELLKIDYGRLTDEMIKEHIDELYTDLKSAEQIKWFPQKNEKKFDKEVK